MSCELRTLLFTSQPARAQLVRLQASWQRVIGGHDYPAPVRQMLGEMVAASALLSASLKFNGSLVLQIKGDGPVRLVVAECSSDLGLRATAMFDRTHNYSDDLSYQNLVNANGNGRFVIILDPRDRLPGQQPYQGIIELAGDNLAQTIENYMLQSEQLQTRLWLAGDQQTVSGVLLQQMPGDGGVAPVNLSERMSNPDFNDDIDDGAASSDAGEAGDDWPRLVMLGDTLKAEELLATAPATLAHRLFWQESHQTLAVRQPVFQCSCSRDKVARMLRSLGETEVEAALAEQGRIEVNCDYCNTGYTFDAVDCKALFVEGSHGGGRIQDQGSGGGALH